MPLYGVGDVARAWDDGRTWTSRFVKTNASPSINTQWADFGFSSGIPAYDAKLGDALTFTPRSVTDQRGGIYLGPTPATGQTKHIVFASARVDPNGATNAVENLLFYDLLGYYPIIDGSVPDEQFMDNTLPLPRYSDGDGVRAVIISHIAPVTGTGTGTWTFVDHAGVTRTSVLRTVNLTMGISLSGASATSNSGFGLYLPMGNGSRGVRSVTSLNFGTVQPGGLLCLMLIRPLFTMLAGGTAMSSLQMATEKCFTCSNASMYPRVYDGAAVNIFSSHYVATTGSTLYGDISVAWG